MEVSPSTGTNIPACGGGTDVKGGAVKRLSMVLVMLGALLPSGWWLGPATAGTGSPNDCSGWQHAEWRIPILTSPITLGIAVWDGTPEYQGGQTTVRLCYSTSPAGASQPDTTGGSVEFKNVPWDVPGDQTTVGCNPQSNPSGVVASCYAGTSPTVGYGNGYILHDDNTVRFAIPVTACLGSCHSATPTLGPTGVVFGFDELVDDFWHPSNSRPAGTSLGYRMTVPYLTLCANGGCQSLSTREDVGIGANPGNVQTLPLTCAPFSLGCYPGGVRLTQGATIVAVQVGPAMVPVSSPTSACASVWETVFPGSQC